MPHLVALVESGVKHLDGEAGMLKLMNNVDPETAQDAELGLNELFARNPLGGSPPRARPHHLIIPRRGECSKSIDGQDRPCGLFHQGAAWGGRWGLGTACCWQTASLPRHQATIECSEYLRRAGPSLIPSRSSKAVSVFSRLHCLS